MTASDRGLRRLAWAGWWFQIAATAGGVPIFFARHADSPAAWGGGGLLGDLVFTSVVLAFPLTGLLILRRQPRNTIGWVLLGIGACAGVSSSLDGYATYGLVIHPGSLPGADVAAAVNEGSWAPIIGLMGTFLILLFPDGHLPSPRWRPVGWLAAVTIVVVTAAVTIGPGPLEEGPVPDLSNPIGLESLELPLLVVLVVFLPLLPLTMMASAVALVLRFRRSRGHERQQLKWLATAAAVVALLYLITMAGSMLGGTPFFGTDPTWLVWLQNAAIVSFVLLPVAIGTAVLRHRLYDIDVVINRALVYGSLSVLLGATYLGSVLVLQQALDPLTRQSELAVAGSTLAVAGLFGPARARIQSAVDRRFYRSRYDAALILDAFSGRLRHELDVEAVGADLRTAVRETVQPAHVSLWLRT